jgi:hypothetical protein
MPGALEDHVLPIHCPKCGAKIEKSLSWLRDNNELGCPCGTTMHLEAEELLLAAETFDDALGRIVRPAPDGDKKPV